jgi:signal transduction histidine kinase/CheY-like chemotaxis protein
LSEDSSVGRRARYLLRLRGPLAVDPTAQTLHGLLLFLLAWMIVGHFVAAVYPLTNFRLGLFALGASGLVAALTLLHLGFFKQACLMYLASTWVYTTVTVAFHTGINSPVLALYVTIPISTAWLLGFRGALWTSCISLSTALVFAVLKIAGLEFPRYIVGGPLGIWTVLVYTVLVGAVPVAHVLKTLQAALAQSRQSHEELQHYKEQLEQLVAQRTAEVVEARDQALAANHAKSAFLANMSHELRTPLNAILGFSYLLQTNTASDEQRRDLAIINRSGEHLLGLINDVLDMARIESGGSAVETEAFDLHALLNDTVNLLRDRARAKNVGLSLEVLPDTPRYVRCDSGKLRQVLTNLLGNAVKYTEEGGIVLRADARGAEPPNDCTLILDVEDTGIGIAPEDQARIFDPFVQAVRTRSARGTGLGLAISRDFVRLLGGSIDLESTPGRGSRFCIELPIETADGSEVMPDSDAVQQVIGLAPGQPEYRVLIVEDQKENWLLLEQLLRTAGFRVLVANDGRQGIESFRTWRPHFIWMDIRLPVLSGLDAAARIRELPGGGDVRIAAVTASVYSSERERVLEAGFDDFVRKPYRPHEIFDCMARHLELRYAYGSGQKPDVEDPAVPLRPEDLATLSASLRAELKNALVTLDAKQIAQVVGHVSEENAAVACILAKMAGQLAYTGILRALESCDSAAVASS